MKIAKKKVTVTFNIEGDYSELGNLSDELMRSGEFEVDQVTFPKLFPWISATRPKVEAWISVTCSKKVFEDISKLLEWKKTGK